jgi:hypothetical protein
MLLNFTSEERALLATVDACIDIPRSTKPAVARKLYDNLKNLVRQLRGLAPILESRGLSLHTKRGTRVADARALLFKYQVPAEELIPRRRVYGDSAALEDACLQLRAAAYAREIRQTAEICAELGGRSAWRAGVAFEAEPMRSDGGQAADPTASLRDADAFDWDAEWWNRSEYERCAAYHRACASKAQTMDRCIEHHKCADLHDIAARVYPAFNGEDKRAKQASKSLSLAESFS